MKMNCPYCGETCETESDLQEGQHVLCPFCGQKFSYRSATATASEESTVNLIMAVCPYCGFGEQIEAQYGGHVGTCSGCNGEFTIMANARGIPFRAPNEIKLQSEDRSAAEELIPAMPSKGMGCLSMILVSLAISICSTYFNFGAVAFAAGAMLLAMLFYLRNRAIGKCGHLVSYAQALQGIGGIYVLPVCYIAFFLLFSVEMKSCQKDRQEFEKDMEAREAQIKEDGGRCILHECPNCRYEIMLWNELQNDGSFVLKHNGDPVSRSSRNWHYNVRCDNCGQYVDLGFHP